MPRRLIAIAVFLLALPSLALAGGRQAGFTAQPSTVTAGETATLSWNAPGASFCVLTPGFGRVPARGSVSVSPASDTLYVLKVKGKGKPATESVLVRVLHPPRVRFEAFPQSIYVGQKSRLSWAVCGVASVLVTPGIGPTGSTGFRDVSPAQTTAYTLTATGPGGTTVKTVTVKVSPLPQGGLVLFDEDMRIGWLHLYWKSFRFSAPGRGTAALTVTNKTPGKSFGGTIHLNGAVISLDAFLGGPGTVLKLPVPVSMMNFMTVILTGQPGSSINVKVALESPNPAPEVGISADPPEIATGGSATLSWSTTNADSVTIEPSVGSVAASGSVAVSPIETTTYTITATSPGGTATDSVTVIVYPPTSVSISADPTSVNLGESTILTFSSTGADSVEIEPGIGSTAPSGSVEVTPAETTTYTISATGKGGTASASVTVTVNFPPTVSLSASPETILAGQQATLTWATENAAAVSIEPGVGAVQASGSVSLSPAESTTYTLTATGPGGTAKATATVTVLKPPAANLSVYPPAIVEGGFAQLEWDTTNADSVVIEPGIGPVPASGIFDIAPADTTAYTLTATGPGGTVRKSVVVTVYHPPTATLTVSPEVVTEGGSVTLTWSTTNGEAIEISPGLGRVAAAGSLNVRPTASTTYVLTVSGPGGTAVASAAVRVNKRPKASAGHAQTAQLAWNADTVDVPLDGSGSSDPDGSVATYSWSGSPVPASAARPVVALPEGVHVFTLVVTDDLGAQSEPDTVTITVNKAHRPVFDPLPALVSGAEGQAVTLSARATDRDGGTLVYSARGLPRGASFDSASGLFTWTPDFDQAGTYAVSLAVSDPTGLTATAEIGFEITNINRPPEFFTSPVETAEVNYPYACDAAAADPDGDALTYSLLAGPAGMNVNPYTGEISWLPDASQAGSQPVRIVVTDALGASAAQAFTVTVAQARDRAAPRVLIAAPSKVTRGLAFTVDISAGDAGGVSKVSLYVDDQLVRDFDAPPYRMSLNAPNEAGRAVNLRAVALDPSGNAGEAKAAILLTEEPDTAAPVIPALMVPSKAAAGETVWLGLTASDDRGVDRVRFFADGAPAGDAFSPPFAVRFKVPAGLAPGAGVLITARVSDAAGNVTDASGTITVTADPDLAAPQNVVLTGPGHVSPGENVTLAASAADDRALFGVAFYADGVWVGSALSAPYRLTFSIPAEEPVGGRVAFTAEAVDFSGNRTRSAPLYADVEAPGRGFVTGAVFDDSRGLPLAGARVSVTAENGAAPSASLSTVSDESGRYSLELPRGTADIQISSGAYTTAYRRLAVSAGAVTRALDARLTPISTGQGADAVTGGVITASGASLSVPASAFAGGETATVTRLTAQGLPAPLPLGWTPVAAFSVGPENSPVAAPLALSVTGLADAGGLVAAVYDASSDKWVRVAAAATPEGLALSLLRTSAVVLARPDADGPPVPAEGAELSGVPAREIPADAVVEVTTTPDVLFTQPGARSEVCLSLSASAGLPSGTRVRVDADESYRLADSSRITPAPFSQDILLFRRPGGLGAEFAASPSPVLDPAAPVTGGINLSVNRPGEGAAAGVMGPGGGAVSAGGATLTVAPGTVAGLVPLCLTLVADPDEVLAADSRFSVVGGVAAVDVDLGGEILTAPATLSLDLGSYAPPANGMLLVRLSEIGGASRFETVAFGKLTGSRVDFGSFGLPFALPGVTRSGRYFLVALNGAFGFAAGRVENPGGFAGNVLVESASFPFVSLVTSADAGFVLPVPAGSATVSALDLSAGRRAQAAVSVASGEVVTVNLSLAAERPRVVSITPVDAARGVDPAAKVTVVFSRAMDAATVTTQSFTVSAGASPVTGAVSLAPDRTSAFFSPAAPLSPGATYKVMVSESVADSFGNRLGSSFASSFTVKDSTPPPKPESGKVILGVPENGTSRVSGSAGAAEPGVTVAARNATTGLTVSCTAAADGSFSLSLEASLTDVVEVSYTDQDGNRTVFDPGLFVTPDGSYMVGAKGGVVYGEGGVSSVVPEGALPDGTAVKLSPRTQADLAIPLADGFQYQGSLYLDMGDVVAEKEIKLSIARPEGVSLTPDTQILVLKSIEARGEPAYTLSNIAHLSGESLTTASPPFPGARSTGKYIWVKPLAPADFVMVVPSALFGLNSPGMEVETNYFGKLFCDPLIREQAPIFAVPVLQNSGDISVTLYDVDSDLTLAVRTFPPLTVVSGLGKLYFPTVADEGAPQVMSASPSPGSTRVAVQRGVEVVFDRQVNAEASKVTLVEKASGATVSGTATFVKDCQGVARSLTFVPDGRLQYGTTYEVQLGGVVGFEGTPDVAVPAGQSSFTFTTFAPVVRGNLRVDTPSDLAMLSDYRLVVSKGYVNDPKASQKGVMLVGTDYPERLRLFDPGSYPVSGDTLGVCAITGADDHRGAAVVSGSLQHLGQIVGFSAASLYTTTSLDGGNEGNSNNVLLCMSIPTLANGSSLTNVPAAPGIPRRVAMSGTHPVSMPKSQDDPTIVWKLGAGGQVVWADEAAAWVATQGVGLEFVTLSDLFSHTQRVLRVGPQFTDPLGLASAEPSSVTPPSFDPMCLSAFGPLVAAGDMHKLYLFGPGLSIKGVPIDVPARAVEGVMGLPWGGGFAEPAGYSDCVFVADRYGRFVAVSVENPAEPEVMAAIPLTANSLEVLNSVRVSTYDRLAYVGGNRGLYVLDIYKPWAPRLLGKVRGVSSVESISLASSFGYVADADHNLVQSFPMRTCIDAIRVKDDKYPVGIGDSAVLEAITSSGTTSVQWTISGLIPDDKTRPVRARLRPGAVSSTEILLVDENSGPGWVLVRAANAADPGCAIEERIPVGCRACMTCSGNAPGSPIPPHLGSLSFRLDLGLTSDGKSAGEIFIHADEPSKDLSTPYGLGFTTLADNVTPVYGEGGAIRQVIAPQAFVDIVADGDYAYDIRFYEPKYKGAMKADGLYEVVPKDAPAIRVWRVVNPDGATNDIRLDLSETAGGSGRSMSYLYDVSAGEWRLTSGGGLTVEYKKVEPGPVEGEHFETHVVQDARAQVTEKTRTLFHKFPWGEEPVETVTYAEAANPNGATLTETTKYYTDPGASGSYGRVKSETHADGSWTRYEYDSEGRRTLVISSWLNAPAGSPASAARAQAFDYSPVDPADAGLAEDWARPRTVTETVLGVVTACSFHAYYLDADGGRVEITERAASQSAGYGDPGNQRSEVTYYPSKTGDAGSARLKSVRGSDGLVTTYAYDLGSYDPATGFAPGAGAMLRTAITHGTTAQPNGIAGKTTREITVENETGATIASETYVLGGSGFQRIAWSLNTLDLFGRVVRTDRSDGSFSTTNWACCHKESETDQTGVTTTFAYDALGREIGETRDGLSGPVTTTLALDAAGRELGRAVTAGGLSQTSATSYDTAGRQLSSTDAAGLVTTYGYSADGRVVTVTQPGGATQVTESYPDGRTRSVTGTGVTPQFYEYGVNPDGAQWTLVRTGAPDSPMWEKTTTDTLGRTVRSEKPGFGGSSVVTETFYDAAGRPVKTTATGRAANLTVYDELGEVTLTALDENGNGAVDLAGPDRVQGGETLYVLQDGAWWQKSTQSIYAGEGSEAPTVTGVSETRVTGLGAGGLSAESESFDVNGNVTISRSYIDRARQSVTTVTHYPDSITDETSVTRFGLTVSATSKTGVFTSFAYDALGRQIAAVDPRKGASLTHYDEK